MELTTDIILKSSTWIDCIQKLGGIFKRRTNYDLFMLALSIGIMYDQRKTCEGSNEGFPSVPRNVLQNNDNGKLDFMFEAAILSTKTVDLDEKNRLELAFGEKTDFNKVAFLTEFANYGIEKIAELIGDNDIDTMEKIKGFAASSVEGTNFEIDSLPQDILLEDLD